MEYEARYGTMVLKELCDTPLSRKGITPVLIADPICDGDVGKLSHDCLGGSIHEL
jgi:hypothetical protein